MTRKITILTALAAMLSMAATAPAQTTERILLPLTPEEVRGANGSRWLTDVVLTNVSTTPLAVTGYIDCAVPLCPAPAPLPPKASLDVTQTLRCETRGTYLHVEAGRTDELAVTLRSRDLSRQAATWGTSVPVVTTEDLHASVFGLTDIPMDPQFRSTLRVYNVDATGGGAVAVRFYSMNPARNSFRPYSDVLLTELRPPFVVPTQGGATSSCPAFFELAIDRIPELAGSRRVRIEIEPLDARRAYWAFVSITHNETQHVTIVAPK